MDEEAREGCANGMGMRGEGVRPVADYCEPRRRGAIVEPC